MECVKDEDTAMPVVSTTDTAVANSQKTDENESTTSVTVSHAPETIASASNDEPIVVNDETSAVPTKSVVVDDGDPVTSEDNQLNVAMASTTLSDANEVKEDPVISNKQQVQETVIAENEGPTVNDTVVNPDVVSEKTLMSDVELNSSTVDGEFEDAHEYVDGEDNCVEKEQDCDEELLNNEEGLKDEVEEVIYIRKII